MIGAESQYYTMSLKRQASQPVAKWFNQTSPHPRASSIFFVMETSSYSSYGFMFPGCNACVDRRFSELLNILFFTVAFHSTSHQIKDLILWWRKCSYPWSSFVLPQCSIFHSCLLCSNGKMDTLGVGKQSFVNSQVIKWQRKLLLSQEHIGYVNIPNYWIQG